MNIQILSQAGGLFALLVFVHFVIDWIFQSHNEAMVKHNSPLIRAKHCFIYTIGFIPLLYMFHFSLIKWVIGLNILFWSHFIEDTYLPVFIWAKYIRKPPEMTEPYKWTAEDGYVHVMPPDPKKGFIEFIKTPMGKILMIVIDQIIHLMFLFPIVYMALY